MNQEERRKYLIQELLDEREEYCHIEIPQNESSQKLLLRDLMNVREPKKIKSEFYRIQDAYLQTAIEEKGIVDVNDLKPIQEGIYLWQGDITTLKCDAIVNAANSQMTGCYIPHHRCIDNCIHSYAGMQLRYACYQIMEKQGKPETTGKAKITKAYNLPSRYILHTVGPIIYSTVTKKDEELLASCYRSCLEFAAAYRLESIAFCCISTGEFHFPKELATKIAIKTVKEYLKNEYGIEDISNLKEIRTMELGHIFQLGTRYSEMMNGKYINKDGKESLYYMGCYGIGVSRTVAALYEYCLINDEKWGPCGFVLPENIAPYKVQIIPKVENEEKMKFANSVYSKLNNSGISCIIDDRENLTIGAKIKDSKVLGTPYIIVIGDKQEGEIIELEDNKKGEKESLTVEELIKKFSK